LILGQANITTKNVNQIRLLIEAQSIPWSNEIYHRVVGVQKLAGHPMNEKYSF